MAGTRPGGKWLFSESVQALRGLKSRFESLDRDALELSVVLLQVREPCPNFRKRLTKDEIKRCLPCESGLELLKWQLCDPDINRQLVFCMRDYLPPVKLNIARCLNSCFSQGWRHPSIPETSREFLIYPNPDPDAANMLKAISEDAAILIHNALAAFGPGAFRLLWPEIPMDSLEVCPGRWFDLVFEAGRWGLPSLAMRCYGKGRTGDEEEDGYSFDIQSRDLWTNPDQPSVLEIPLERFASKSAAVIDLLVQWGETGVNPFQSRVDAQRCPRPTTLPNDYKREMVRLDTDLQLLKSSNPIHERLKTAYGYWGTYPLQRELLVDSPRREATDEHAVSETYLVLLKLDEVHKAAVDVLMSRSKEQGGNPTLIWKSANYCRELLADYQKTHNAYPAIRESDYWPECLGPTLFELPADIRQAIQDGNAEVRTLCVPPELLIDGLPKPAGEKPLEADSEPPKPGETLAGRGVDGVGQGAEAEFVFRRVGEDDYFIRGFREEGQVSASRAIGLHDLYRVVQTPGVGVPMRELDAGPGVTQAKGDEQSCQPAFDGETRKQLAARRSELKNDIESAKSDLERNELQGELDQLESSAKAMTGLSGKPRDLNNPLNNLRPKFLGRKATVIALIRKQKLPTLADHFEATVTSEAGCLIYSPGVQNLSWDTSDKK